MRFKRISGNFNYRSITFFCVTDCQCQALIFLRHERKVAVVVIINEIFFTRFCNFGIEHIFAACIFQQIPVGGNAFFDFSVFSFLRTGNDLINLVSVRSGYSIGAFDADRIEGDTLILGVGKEGEIFRGIGRGVLNIEGLPVYRDDKGGIGTPTSDEERTKITLDTKNLFVIINAYGEEMPLDETIAFTTGLLRQYASAENIRTDIVSADLFID